MAEVDIQGGGCYWQKLVSALGGTLEGSELLCWGKVGRVLRRMVPPGHETDDPDNDEQLHVRTSSLRCTTPEESHGNSAI